jgi:hypothetical protein
VRYYYPQRGFEGNAAYDIWFDKTGKRPQGRGNGIWWGYMTWNAGQPGHTWHYIRYWRLSGWMPHSAATLNLVPFFKDAESTGDCPRPGT